MRYTYKAFHPHQKDHLLLIIDKQPVQCKCIPVLKTSERERERERESFIRNNLHNGVVSGAARGQALRGPMWAGLTPDSKGDPAGDTGGLIAADRRHHTCLRDAREHCRPLQAARQVPGKKN